MSILQLILFVYNKKRNTNHQLHNYTINTCKFCRQWPSPTAAIATRPFDFLPPPLSDHFILSLWHDMRLRRERHAAIIRSVLAGHQHGRGRMILLRDRTVNGGGHRDKKEMEGERDLWVRPHRSEKKMFGLHAP